MPERTKLQGGGTLSAWLVRQRLGQISPYLRGRVLDFGCHQGQLAALCDPGAYVGVDHDREVIELARREHPSFEFVDRIPPGEGFDTVAALAVIEHIDEPGRLLRAFTDAMNPGGRIVLTTPHPRAEPLHTLAAKVGLLSRAAHDDHETLIDHPGMARLAADAGLEIELYRPFMLGLNQLFVLRRP